MDAFPTSRYVARAQPPQAAAPTARLRRPRLARINRSFPPEILKQFRAHFGVSQHELAALLGLGKNRVSEYERLGVPEWMRYALIGLAHQHYGVPQEDTRTRLPFLYPAPPVAEATRPALVTEEPPARS